MQQNAVVPPIAPQDINAQAEELDQAAIEDLDNAERGYVQMAVMDGKTVGHRVRTILSEEPHGSCQLWTVADTWVCF